MHAVATVLVLAEYTEALFQVHRYAMYSPLPTCFPDVHHAVSAASCDHRTIRGPITAQEVLLKAVLMTRENLDTPVQLHTSSVVVSDRKMFLGGGGDVQCQYGTPTASQSKLTQPNSTQTMLLHTLSTSSKVLTSCSAHSKPRHTNTSSLSAVMDYGLCWHICTQL